MSQLDWWVRAEEVEEGEKLAVNWTQRKDSQSQATQLALGESLRGLRPVVPLKLEDVAFFPLQAIQAIQVIQAIQAIQAIQN
jgi:hypothetical protein